ncbi:MAG: GNAT family N-acetyltransferase [Myxococcaceae bacterium]
MKLRPVVDADLEALFHHQAHPEVKALAEHPGRDRDAFFVHMRERVMNRPDALFDVIELDGGVIAGNVCAWAADGKWWLGYLLGREFWGRGLATAAVRAFLPTVTARPLFADVAKANVPSQHVLEKCGFQRIAEHPNGFEYELPLLPRRRGSG